MNDSDVNENRGDKSPILMLLGYKVVLFRSESDQDCAVGGSHREASGKTHQCEYSDVDADEDHREGIRACEQRLQKSPFRGGFILGGDCFDRTKPAVRTLGVLGRRQLVAGRAGAKSGVVDCLFQESVVPCVRTSSDATVSFADRNRLLPTKTGD